MNETQPMHVQKQLALTEEWSPVDVNSQYELEQALTDHTIPLECWGEGATKTAGHLFKEIYNRESRLVSASGTLGRIVAVATVDIRTYRGGQWFTLLEDRQVFHRDDRAERNRMHSLSEKMTVGELPTNAALRGINEELGVAYDGILRELSPTLRLAESKSYPGLLSQYRVYPFMAIFTPPEYRKEYVEHQDDRSTYFHWYPLEKLPKSQ